MSKCLVATCHYSNKMNNQLKNADIESHTWSFVVEDDSHWPAFAVKPADSYQLYIPACDLQPQSPDSTLGTVCSCHLLQKDSRCSLGPLGRSATAGLSPVELYHLKWHFHVSSKSFVGKYCLNFVCSPSSYWSMQSTGFQKKDAWERLPKCWSYSTTGSPRPQLWRQTVESCNPVSSRT